MPIPRSRLSRRRTRTFLIGASILILLGLGNLVFSRLKINQYRAILPATNVHTEAGEQEVQKALSRLEYYHVTQRGGIVFIALGLVLLALAIRPQESQEGSDQPQ